MSTAAACMTLRPAAVLPVNEILSISGCAVSAAPTPSAPPFTTLTTPAGTPPSATRSSSACSVGDVSSDGFSTTAQPAASAGASFHAVVTIGKFHGMTSAATPTES